MKIMSSLVATLALFLSLGVVRADEVADKAELLRVEKATAAALVAHDPKALAEFLVEDWKLVSADATIIKRAELFKLLDEGTLKFESYKISDLDVRVYGDSAVIIGRGDSKLEWKGEVMESKEVFTDVFIRRDGKWRCVSSHSCDLPDAESK